jgi:hypothetical protein
MAFFDFLGRFNPLRGLKGFLGAAPGASPAPAPSAPQPPPPPAANAPAGAGDEWALSGEWLHLASSNVDAIRYDWDHRVLDVAFLSGAIYQYFEIPPDVAEAFSRTSSPGRWVWRVLRARAYDYVRLTFAPTKQGRPTPTVIRPALPSELAKKWAGVVPLQGQKPMQPAWMRNPRG